MSHNHDCYIVDPEDLPGAYDTAVPIGFQRHVHKATGENVSGHFVWFYPKGELFGFPVAITLSGARTLAALAHSGEAFDDFD